MTQPDRHLVALAREPAAVAVAGVLTAVATLLVGLWFTNDATLGDLALIEMETRRVFSSSPPLVGAYSRYGWRHPGPILFWVLQVPYVAFGASARALATGALLVNATAMVTAIVLARRQGAAAAAAVGAALLLLAHGTGSDGIGDAWNVSVTLAPLVLLVVACWSAVCGDPWGPPVMLLAFVFVAETHIGNGVAITPVVLATTAIVLASRERRRTLLASRRRLTLTAMLAGLAILPVLIDAWRDPPGNIGRLLRWSVRRDEPGLTWGDTLRLLGRTSSLSFPFEPEQPRFLLEATTDSAGVLPGVLVAMLAAVAVAAWRAGRTPEAPLCALILGWWGAAVLAVRAIVSPPAWWLVEWLQPLGWLTVAATVLTAWRLWAPDSAAWIRPVAVAGLLGATTLAVAAQVTTVADWRGREVTAAIPVETLASAAAIAAQPSATGSSASGHGVSITLDGPGFAGESMLAGVVNELDRRGVRVCVEPRLAYKFPPTVVCSGVGTTRLVLRSESSVEPAPPGTSTLAVADALDADTRTRADATRRSVLAALQADGTAELAGVVDTALIADVLLERPSPSVAALADEIRWLDTVYSDPHARYALYRLPDDT